jgi:hypothetical protein
MGATFGWTAARKGTDMSRCVNGIYRPNLIGVSYSVLGIFVGACCKEKLYN